MPSVAFWSIGCSMQSGNSSKAVRRLEAWQEEIGRMWRFSRSNGIIEGFHRIQRRAFGFRNFENYRRVRAICA